MSSEGACPEPVTLVSLLPNTYGGVGHNVGYDASVHRAALQCGWRHVTLVSREEAQPPADWWQAVLHTGWVSSGLVAALRRGSPGSLWRDIGSFADSLAQALRRTLEESAGPCILFVEDFNGPLLLALDRTMRALATPRLHLWLMYRYDPRGRGIAGRLYNRIARRLASRLAGGRLHLLVDSEPLATAVHAAFGRRARVLPVPHTPATPAAPFAREATEVVCWWPGAPRPIKGLAAMERLVATAPSSDRPALRLVVSEEARFARLGGAVRLHPVGRVLAPADYTRWLFTADCVLLPYDATHYGMATSGIFVEAVAAGAMPLVSEGTWMASELRRFGLPELVLDWSDPGAVLDRIGPLLADAGLRSRRDRMRTHYAAFHSEAGLARVLKELSPGLPASGSGEGEQLPQRLLRR